MAHHTQTIMYPSDPLASQPGRMSKETLRAGLLCLKRESITASISKGRTRMSDTQKRLEIANLEKMVQAQPPASQPDPAALNNLHNLNPTEGVDTSADED